MLRSRLRWKYTEDDVAEAILDVTDNGFSPLQAAHRRGVPRRTLIDRLHGRGAVKEQIHPHRRLSKRQEDRLAFWILRQESLGYAPSHSQIRACVMGLLRQQGEHPNLGRNWVIKFINRRADLKTKMGRRQEAKRFDSFTPKAVHWYFDIRDGQYGWIKPENTVNADEGGIMTGFGLDSLVVGSADPKRKAFLKGPQTRNWTSFIEAVTADGRALVPGIIFKGKELQKQWFLEEFKQIADWYYITSPNGWTDDHIGIEWLERVYLPQTTPADESDARLIILDGHGSHETPLDNGVFNALKAAYRRELERFASLTDSAPMDKVNFIRAYAKARRVGMTKKNILSGWRVTGNWPISRAKALRHPEIQQDRPNGSPRVTPEPRPYLGSDDTPQTSRQIRDLGLNKTPKTRRRYNVIAKGFEAHQQTVAAHTQRIASLEEELARLKRGKKRKAVPNPNKRFMTLGETLAGKESIPEGATRYTPIGVEFISSSEQESASEAGSVIEVAKRLAIPESLLSWFMPRSLKYSMAFHESLTKDKVARRIEIGDSSQRKDFFAHILRRGDVNRDHLAEQAKILLLDGSETTATFLAGITYLLLKSPTVLARLQNEVRSSFSTKDEIRGDSTKMLPYLHAVIEEGLRLFPPVPLGLPRTCPGAIVDRWFVPPGTEVSVDNFVMSHDAQYFPEPDKFRPERWLGDQTASDKEASRPFSIGPRACLGVNLAYFEARLILATMVFQFDWELVNKDLDWFGQLKLMTFWKKPELWVRYHPPGSLN
ncbi:hypothetical protein FPOA_12327 [Fusarium poae]|uniref:HTH CENPB-type domain-containing protein n=1 Tax=Fusarium poae TaxID=36050 RepID=A0A1B8A9K8_FUSPO|nr:hypothetical protein FPOA_12327 [Fusarium poae]